MIGEEDLSQVFDDLAYRIGIGSTRAEKKQSRQPEGRIFQAGPRILQELSHIASILYAKRISKELILLKMKIQV